MLADVPGAINGYGAVGEAGAPSLPDLYKALQSGYQYHVTDQTGGGAMRVESLEASLKVLTYTENNVRFWKKLPKMPAYNTVEEYNQLSAYGDNANAFVPEGVLPESEDTTYQRQVAMVKFMGTTRVVTHPATLVRSAHGDIVTLENKNGILWLLRQIERNLFFGDNSLCFNYGYGGSGPVEGIEWGGLDKQIGATNYIDAKGGSLTEGLLEDSAELIAENYGQVTDVFCPYKVASDLSKSMYPKERIFLPSADGGIQAGTVINTFNSQFGPVFINADVFLTKHRKAISQAPSAASSANAPATPASITGGSPTGTDGQWKTASIASPVQYKVTAVNRFGESAATSASTGVTVTSTSTHVPLTITNAATLGGLLPDYFNVYRSDDGGLTFWYLFSVATGSQTGSGTTTVNDTGLYMTNVSSAFIGELAPHVIALKQLAPLMKMDIAVLGPAIRWMILFYATGPVLYAPNKWVKIINIGDYAS